MTSCLDQKLLAAKQGEPESGSDSDYQIKPEDFKSLARLLSNRTSPMKDSNPFFYERRPDLDHLKGEAKEEQYPQELDPYAIAKQELQDELAKGEIPDYFAEAYRFILEPTAELDPVVETAQRVLDRLWSHTGLPEELKPRLLLSDHDYENAAVFLDAVPPLLMLTTGFLKACNTEDEIAGLIAHELGHIYIRHLASIEDVTRGEETSADEYGTQLAFDAGYDPRAQKTVWLRLREAYIQKTKRSVVNLFNLLDVHADFNTRIRNNDDHVGVLGFKGDTRVEVPPLSAEFKSALATKHFQSEASLAIDSLAEVDLPTAVNNIKELIDLLLDRNPIQWSGTWNEVIGQVKNLKVETEADKALLLQVFSDLAKVEHEQVARIAYQIHAVLKVSNTATIISKLDDAIGNLCGTLRSPGSQLLQDAETVKALVPEVAQFSIAYLKLCSWFRPYLETVDAGDLRVSWEDSYQLYKSQNAEVIVEAFYLLGVDDPRLKSEYAALLVSSRRVFCSRTDWGGIAKHEIRVAENDKLALLDVAVDAARFKRPTRVALRMSEGEERDKRTAAVREVIDDVNWDLLKTDLDAFFESYREFLTPFISLVPGSDEFEQKFCEQLVSLLEENPDLAYRCVKRFFGTAADGVLNSLISDYTRRYKVWIGYHTANEGQNRLFVGSIKEDQERFQIRVAPSHPYIDFMRKHRDLFTTAEAMQLLSVACQDFTDHDQLLDNGYPIENLEALNAFEQMLTACREELNQGNVCGNYWHQIREYALHKKLEYMETRAPAYLDLEALGVHGNKEVSVIGDEKNVVLDRQVARNSEFELSSACTTDVLLEKYISYSTNGRFKAQPKLGDMYATELLKRFAHELTPEEQISKIELVLKSGEINAHEIRESFIDLWADACVGAYGYGYDDANGDFSKAAAETLARLQKDLPAALVPVLAVRFLRRTVSQREVVYSYKKNLQTWAIKKGIAADQWLRLADFSMGSIRKVSDLSDQLLDFFSQPASQESCQRLVSFLESKISEFKKLGAVDEDTRVLGVHLFKPTRTAEDVRLWEAKTLHENFWALPFEVRTLWLGRVIFPVGETDEAKLLDKSVELVDRLFVDGDKNSAIGKKIVSYLIEEYPPESRRLMISALMAGSPGNLAEGMRPGQILVQVLSKFPGAGGRMLQAIHSYLNSLGSDDPEIQQLVLDLEKTKTTYNELLPWTIFETIDEVVPEEILAEFGRIGPAAGSGVYSQTIEVEHQGQRAALSVAREDIEEDGDYHFKIFRKVIQRLVKDDPDWAPLEGLVSSAEESHAIDSNFEFRGKQAEYTAQIYDQLEITVDGYTFKFKAVDVYGYGKRFVLASFAEGEHFNDLVKEADPAYVKALAKAKVLAEMYHLLSGKATDIDHHGAQAEIEGENITVLDPGGIPYDHLLDKVKHPSEEELFALGRTLKLLRESDPKKTASQRINETFNIAKTTLGHESYLNNTHRLVLAWGDYLGAIGDEQERMDFLESAIGAVIATGHANESILKGANLGVVVKIASRIFSRFPGGIKIKAVQYTRGE